MLQCTVKLQAEQVASGKYYLANVKKKRKEERERSGRVSLKDSHNSGTRMRLGAEAANLQLCSLIAVCRSVHHKRERETTFAIVLEL